MSRRILFGKDADLSDDEPFGSSENPVSDVPLLTEGRFKPEIVDDDTPQLSSFDPAWMDGADAFRRNAGSQGITAEDDSVPTLQNDRNIIIRWRDMISHNASVYQILH